MQLTESDPTQLTSKKKPCYFDVYSTYQSFSSCLLGYIINSKKKHKNTGKNKEFFTVIYNI